MVKITEQAVLAIRTAEGSPPELDAAGRVARAMLHEIRNVLNPIVSAAYLLDANAENPEKVRDLARRIEGFAEAEERIASRMRQLLAEESELLEGRASAGAGTLSEPSSSTV